MTRFRQIRTPRLEGDAEAVRREHELAIEELRREIRRIDGGPRMIGVAHIVLSADQGPSVGDVIEYDTEVANTTRGLVVASDARVRLAPGYTYLLSASAGVGGSGTEVIAVQWYDVRAGEFVGSRSRCYVPGSSGTVGVADAATACIAATSFVELEPRVQGMTGTPVVSATYSHCTVGVLQ